MRFPMACFLPLGCPSSIFPCFALASARLLLVVPSFWLHPSPSLGFHDLTLVGAAAATAPAFGAGSPIAQPGFSFVRAPPGHRAQLTQRAGTPASGEAHVFLSRRFFTYVVRCRTPHGPAGPAPFDHGRSAGGRGDLVSLVEWPHFGHLIFGLLRDRPGPALTQVTYITVVIANGFAATA